MKHSFFTKFINSTKATMLATGSSLGLLSFAGACGAGCGLGAISIATILTSAGLGALAVYLPYLRFPFLIISIVLAVLVIRNVNRQGNPTKSSIVACLMGGLLVFLGFQAFKSNPCNVTTGTMLSKLSPETQKVVKLGIFSLWPKLGHAPTVTEIKQGLGYSSDEPVLKAFNELRDAGWNEIFHDGTNEIKWVWPLSMIDHGVIVTLEGEKPVFARCAVDALGMSKMFGKPAQITVTTPLFHERLTFLVNGINAKLSDKNTVISTGDSCDDVLFFSSREEFDQYKEKNKKPDLKILTFDQALARGIKVFGKILEG